VQLSLCRSAVIEKERKKADQIKSNQESAWLRSDWSIALG
jgi:hypothetical protein